MSDERELKPCPFCGEYPYIEEYIHNSIKPNDWRIQCDDCLIGFSKPTEDEAIDKWNTRINAKD